MDLAPEKILFLGEIPTPPKSATLSAVGSCRLDTTAFLIGRVSKGDSLFLVSSHESLNFGSSPGFTGLVLIGSQSRRQSHSIVSVVDPPHPRPSRTRPLVRRGNGLPKCNQILPHGDKYATTIGLDVLCGHTKH